MQFTWGLHRISSKFIQLALLWIHNAMAIIRKYLYLILFPVHLQFYILLNLLIKIKQTAKEERYLQVFFVVVFFVVVINELFYYQL